MTNGSSSKLSSRMVLPFHSYFPAAFPSRKLSKRASSKYTAATKGTLGFIPKSHVLLSIFVYCLINSLGHLFSMENCTYRRSLLIALKYPSATVLITFCLLYFYSFCFYYTLPVWAVTQHLKYVKLLPVSPDLYGSHSGPERWICREATHDGRFSARSDTLLSRQQPTERPISLWVHIGRPPTRINMIRQHARNVWTKPDVPLHSFNTQWSHNAKYRRPRYTVRRRRLHKWNTHCLQWHATLRPMNPWNAGRTKSFESNRGMV